MIVYKVDYLTEREAAAIRMNYPRGDVDHDIANMRFRFRTGDGVVEIEEGTVWQFIADWKRTGCWSLHGRDYPNPSEGKPMDNDDERLVDKVAAALHSRTISQATAEMMITHILCHVDGGLRRTPAVISALRGETGDHPKEKCPPQLLHTDKPKPSAPGPSMKTVDLFLKITALLLLAEIVFMSLI